MARRGTVIVLVSGFTLISVVHAWGRWLQTRGFRMRVNAPPLTGNVDPRASAWSLPALAVAVGAVGGADEVARSLPWRRLLWAAFAGALLWTVALALWDGASGLTRSPGSGADYLAALPSLDGLGGFLRTLVLETRSLPTHVQAHPPGMVVLLLAMREVGIASTGWIAALEHLAGAASVPAVLLVAREVGGERVARAAAPFIVFSPIAIAWSSGDAVFLGVGAWAVALLVLATGAGGRRADGMALAGGVLWALAAFLSYGIVLLGLVPLVVAWRRERLRVVALGTVPVIAAVGLAAAGGFWWFEGLAATREAYAHSVARVRPYPFFLVANLAAVAVVVGPAVWVGLARLRDRRIWWLAGAVLTAIAIADVSGLSKAEVERIWLPFLPWLVIAAGAALGAEASSRSRRVWLGAQVAWALLVQAVVLSPW
ncbi:MAG: hypothetical protein OEW46_10525 [Actinomycetota bacterium]|nr:hypothetical protein [Actinomycetota bacterium]